MSLFQLPGQKDLPINKLSACFENTSTTYKFYWLLAILELTEGKETSISKRKLFATMISNAWYTVNYFKISFGKQDKIQRAVESIKVEERITIDEKKPIILKQLIDSKNQNTVSELLYFNDQVPHWFLSPWFSGKERKEIYELSKNYENDCPYSLHKEHIEINPRWKNYLIKHNKILKHYCYWNLALYLQAKNPSVPDIPNKIFKEAERQNLKNQRVKYWDVVLKELGSIKCIYTDANLTIGNYHVEHFVPYSFVSHNLIWNLIPADISFNSFKSNKLPPLDEFFDKFFHLQQTAIQIVKNKDPHNTFLEDYLTIFPNTSKAFSKDSFLERVEPLITIAHNNGFEFMASHEFKRHKY